jgi:hypothetical protein
MTKPDPDDFFSNIDYPSIIDTVKGIFTSDGAMATLLDYERVLDEADLYAFKNWEIGELVAGPNVKKYTVDCTFMYPYKLMPDPRGAKRLISVGCKLKFKKTKIKLPVKVETEDDYVPEGNYPKSTLKEIWLIYIQIPKEIMDDVREGSIDLADQTIDLEELDDSYDEDLDQDDGMEEEEQAQNQPEQVGGPGMEQQPGAMPQAPM